MVPMLKRLASLAAESATFARFIGLLEQAGDDRPNLLRVLTYHRVDRPEAHAGLYPGLISATPEGFEQQMNHLARHYSVIAIADVLNADQSGTGLAPRSVLITFDDAYHDFAEHAWPILRHHHLPATLFVPTAFPDQPARSFWWDWLYQALNETAPRSWLDTPAGRLRMATSAHRRQAFRRLRDYVKTRPHHEMMAWVEQFCSGLGVSQGAHRVLSWETLRQLAREGVTLGAHTRNHPLLSRVSLDEARTEAVGSLRDLERQVGPVPHVFAYPSGQLTPDIVRVVRQAGFALGFATTSGINDLRTADRLQLRRINVGQRTNVAVLTARLLPWSTYIRPWRAFAGI
jgi:peptidoglycan/xylan/chitin deacetylase (PgdA/CDA1 family)